MFLGLLALASCVTPQGIKDRKPDNLVNFSGSPEAVAKCISNDWFDQFGRGEEGLYFDQTFQASPRSKPAEDVAALWFGADGD